MDDDELIEKVFLSVKEAIEDHAKDTYPGDVVSVRLVGVEDDNPEGDDLIPVRFEVVVQDVVNLDFGKP